MGYKQLFAVNELISDPLSLKEFKILWFEVPTYSALYLSDLCFPRNLGSKTLWEALF